MAKLLYLEASPRKDRSSSIAVAGEFLNVYRASHPDDTVETLDLWKLDLPEIDPEMVNARYSTIRGTDPSPEQTSAWKRIRLIFDDFSSADKYLFSLPMWNFGPPYRLKHFIDVVTQPDLAFRYSREKGVTGLMTGRPAALVMSRGENYRPGSGIESYDFQKPYLEFWLHFIGFTTVRSIVVDRDLKDTETGEVGRAAAIKSARRIALEF